MEQLHVESFN